MFKENISNTVQFIRKTFNEAEGFIPLHEPRFWGNEKELILDTVDSTFVSSVGQYVTDFEVGLAEYTGAEKAIVTMNGTAALHMALLSVGVKRNDLVLTQSLTFVATCNAISYIDATPCFVDVDKATLNICPHKLESFLENESYMKDNECTHKQTKKKISAIVVMHTFGHMAEIDTIVRISHKYNIKVVEDAAEALGSYYKGKHAGCFGDIGILSFNGNKVITTGGGGALLVNDESLGHEIKHLTTTAKVKHAWEFRHDRIGYNYRMPNLNAALGCAQLSSLNYYLEQKRKLADIYTDYFSNINGFNFYTEQVGRKANYWLNILILESKTDREVFLKSTNESGVMTRPIWELMDSLSMFSDCPQDDLSNSKWLADRIVNIPSSVLRDI